ncbi:MAG: TIGR04255 family protein [Bacilli bacterium]
MTHYQNSPIIETVCEFRFPAATEWIENIAELFYDKIKEQFPIREERSEISIKATINVKSSESQLPADRKITPIHIFRSEDKKLLIQMAVRRLSIHFIKPYSSWDDFYPAIQLAYDALKSLIKVTGFERIGLLYLDRIEFESPGSVQLMDYFTIYPVVSKSLPQKMVNFAVGCDFLYDDRDICRVNLQAIPSEKKGNYAAMLTTDYFLWKKEALSVDEVFTWIGNAHSRSNEIFDHCITDKLAKMFGREDL